MTRRLAFVAACLAALGSVPAQADDQNGFMIRLRLGSSAAVVDSSADFDSPGPDLLPLPDLPDVAGAASVLPLGPSAPNPFHDATRVRYTLREAAEGQLAVYDVRGRLLRVLVRGRIEAGEHTADWDARDAAGTRVPEGTYLAVLATPGGAWARRLLVTR